MTDHPQASAAKGPVVYLDPATYYARWAAFAEASQPDIPQAVRDLGDAANRLMLIDELVAGSCLQGGLPEIAAIARSVSHELVVIARKLGRIEE